MVDKFAIRVSWFDKQMNKYDSGSWHNSSELSNKFKWVDEQNKKYPFIRYWIEGCKYISDKKNKKNIEKNPFFSNIETFNIIKNETEFILV
jgi:hypothetical protein